MFFDIIPRLRPVPMPPILDEGNDFRHDTKNSILDVHDNTVLPSNSKGFSDCEAFLTQQLSKRSLCEASTSQLAWVSQLVNMTKRSKSLSIASAYSSCSSSLAPSAELLAPLPFQADDAPPQCQCDGVKALEASCSSSQLITADRRTGSQLSHNFSSISYPRNDDIDEPHLRSRSLSISDVHNITAVMPLTVTESSGSPHSPVSTTNNFAVSTTCSDRSSRSNSIVRPDDLRCNGDGVGLREEISDIDNAEKTVVLTNVSHTPSKSVSFLSCYSPTTLFQELEASVRLHIEEECSHWFTRDVTLPLVQAASLDLQPMVLRLMEESRMLRTELNKTRNK